VKVGRHRPVAAERSVLVATVDVASSMNGLLAHDVRGAIAPHLANFRTFTCRARCLTTPAHDLAYFATLVLSPSFARVCLIAPLCGAVSLCARRVAGRRKQCLPKLELGITCPNKGDSHPCGKAATADDCRRQSVSSMKANVCARRCDERGPPGSSARSQGLATRIRASVWRRRSCRTSTASLRRNSSDRPEMIRKRTRDGEKSIPPL
jgi:hypothetical protein